MHRQFVPQPDGGSFRARLRPRHHGSAQRGPESRAEGCRRYCAGFGIGESYTNISYTPGFELAEFVAVMKYRKPVVVVGNLTVGGTGKTPLVAWLADRLTARKLTVGIVSRGYGSAYDVPHLVEVDGSERLRSRRHDENAVKKNIIAPAADSTAAMKKIIDARFASPVKVRVRPKSLKTLMNTA